MRSFFGVQPFNQTLGLAADCSVVIPRMIHDDPQDSTSSPKDMDMKVIFCVRQPGHHFRCSQTHTRGFGIDEGWPGLGYDSLYYYIPCLWFWFTLPGNYMKFIEIMFAYVSSPKALECFRWTDGQMADAATEAGPGSPGARRQDVLDYYSKIMQFRGIQNPPGRFQDGILKILWFLCDLCGYGVGMVSIYVDMVWIWCGYGVDMVWIWSIPCRWLLQASGDLSFRWYFFRGPLAMWQVVVPENMDMKDKFSLTQAALYWDFIVILDCLAKALKP